MGGKPGGQSSETMSGGPSGAKPLQAGALASMFQRMAPGGQAAPQGAMPPQGGMQPMTGVGQNMRTSGPTWQGKQVPAGLQEQLAALGGVAPAAKMPAQAAPAPQQPTKAFDFFGKGQQQAAPARTTKKYNPWDDGGRGYWDALLAGKKSGNRYGY